MREMFRRRTFLTAVSTAAVGLAGCGGDSGDEEPTDTETATATVESTATATAEPTATATETATPAPSVDADWPTYHYSAGNLGVHPDATGLSGSPSTVWTYDLGTPTQGSLGLVDGTLFVGAGSTKSSDDDGAIHAIDAISGGRVWKTGTDGPVHATPVIKDGLVFAGSDTGTMYALSTASGDDFWTYSVSSNAGFGTAHVADGNVLAATKGGRFLRILANSGGRTGVEDVASPVRTAIARARGVTYLGTNSGSVLALAGSEAESWEYDEGRGIGGVATNGRAIYATSRGGNVFALNTNGRLLWEFGTRTAVRHNPVVDGEWTFFGTDGGEIYGLKDGLEAWKTEVEPNISNAPVLVEKTLYFVGDDGTVFALDRATGETKWTHSLAAPVENSTPIVSGGYLWVPSLDGILYALQG